MRFSLLSLLRLIIVFGAAALVAPISFSSPAAAQSAVPARTADPALVRLQERLDQIEVQVREITGENERLRFELVQARERIDRLERLATGGAAPSAGASLSPEAGGQASASTSAPAQASAADAAAVFDAAKALLDGGDFGGAEAAFAAFLDQHPQDARKPDALYWRGRTMLARSAHREAAQSFLEVVRGHPRATVAPDALVNLGVALGRMGDSTRACQAYADLARLYPRAAPATKAQAAREARAAQCPA